MLTEKDYCDYETCVALKELGYNEKSNWWFTKVLIEEYDQMQLVHICDNPAHLNYDSWGICPKDFVIRPTMWEAQKWLRKKKRIIVEVFVDDDSNTPITYNIYKYGHCVCHHHGKYWSVEEWETALSEGIKEAVKILKDGIGE